MRKTIFNDLKLLRFITQFIGGLAVNVLKLNDKLYFLFMNCIKSFLKRVLAVVEKQFFMKNSSTESSLKLI